MNCVRRPAIALLAAAMIVGLAACSEKPQRVISGDQGSYNLPPGSPLAERMRNQGETERMGN